MCIDSSDFGVNLTPDTTTSRGYIERKLWLLFTFGY